MKFGVHRGSQTRELEGENDKSGDDSEQPADNNTSNNNNNMHLWRPFDPNKSTMQFKCIQGSETEAAERDPLTEEIFFLTAFNSLASQLFNSLV